MNGILTKETDLFCLIAINRKGLQQKNATILNQKSNNPKMEFSIIELANKSQLK